MTFWILRVIIVGLFCWRFATIGMGWDGKLGHYLHIVFEFSWYNFLYL